MAFEEAYNTSQPLLLVYIWEDLLLESNDYDLRHWRFVRQSLDDLNKQLSPHGHWLLELKGDALKIFEHLHQQNPIKKIFSHQEIGIKSTFTRDLRLQAWCKNNQIDWIEYPTNAVRRGLKHRKDWNTYWYGYMNHAFDDPQMDLLRNISRPKENSNPAPTSTRKLLDPAILQDLDPFQQGGELLARKCLLSFVKERAKGYAKTISLPHESRTHNSRLSPYLAWGNLSVRQVHQSFEKFKNTDYGFDIKACHERLKWRCHFVQKFESECRIEFENQNPYYDRLQRTHDEELFEKWKKGETGFPLVDAAMRAVNKTGWLNFRMRAMVISFLTHYLWQHWKEGAVWLGSRFLDFEPGIHYPQVQMQAGTTGIHTVRVYNPVKQAKEKDPSGTFIKEWVPELSNLPSVWVHEPSKCPPLEQQFHGFEIGRDYPLPMIDASSAYQNATDRLWSIKKDKNVRREGRRIMKTHVKPGRRWE